ncbi:BHLH domain-containing protein [Mycena sanguinolenta]|uniref:BHLH domain-containing protein n=1 Tax=Mycena sanguinolenta TaxID=230812 RepID=A0A8H6XAZ9_9AGAR|nr:BHLH domain-containing protein [Mycena sanguinolenta]
MAMTTATTTTTAAAPSPSADVKPVVPDAAPASPVNANAKTETDATNAPSTTGSAGAPAAPKRRAARRANTAERRATHNAVERMRRETLNGRFLTLASLLPPLAALRRPSKAAIVSSSIATVNAARRHRVLAAQTLRALSREAEQLRREVNEWRARARVPQLDIPVRSDAHHAVLRAELEDFDLALEDGVVLEEEGDEEDNDDANNGHSSPGAGDSPAPVSPQSQSQSPVSPASAQEEQFRRARSASTSVPGSAHGFPAIPLAAPMSVPMAAPMPMRTFKRKRISRSSSSSPKRTAARGYKEDQEDKGSREAASHSTRPLRRLPPLVPRAAGAVGGTGRRRRLRVRVQASVPPLGWATRCRGMMQGGMHPHPGAAMQMQSGMPMKGGYFDAPAPVGAGAAYDLGLGFEAEESLLLGSAAPSMSAANNMAWASANPAHPAFAAAQAQAQAVRLREVYEQQAQMLGMQLGGGVGMPMQMGMNAGMGGMQMSMSMNGGMPMMGGGMMGGINGVAQGQYLHQQAPVPVGRF